MSAVFFLVLQKDFVLKVNDIENYFVLLEGGCKQSQKFIGKTTKEYSWIQLKL